MAKARVSKLIWLDVAHSRAIKNAVRRGQYPSEMAAIRRGLDLLVAELQTPISETQSHSMTTAKNDCKKN